MKSNNILALATAIFLFGCSVLKNTSSMDKNKHPKVYIGYYLKTTDNLLTEKMDKIHEANNMTRAEWQIINGIAETPNMYKDILLQSVKQFTSLEQANELLENLIKIGWVQNPEQLNLTETGKEVHAKSLQMQKEFRIKIMNGITQKEYQNVITTLDKMIHNLQEQ